ncbi:FliH/SctL family protein [Pseudoroseicyclus aestuarii]|uniref:Flagellar assembly protein FliH n=1 Tax=Pseudoroseicyclus aestuarii TaxID=1795041 RepID=A0A318SRF0_9RHOB|nr:FliH/SctL family protein [Pseudoroseicyclus aestuarii]PYE84511.1 flagellar assembly protein FliH [Pseudoroseicyclus aestuarii]
MGALFQRDFDAELAEEQRAAVRAAHGGILPEEVEAAIEAARAEARAEGLAQGRAEGRAEAEAARAAADSAALQALGPQLTDIAEAAGAHRAALERQLLGYVQTICTRVFPELIEHRAEARAAARIRRAITLALGSGQLRIAVAPGSLAALTPSIRAVAEAEGLTARLEIEADPALRPGAISARWDDGVFDYSFDAICEQILASLRQITEKEAPRG